MKLARKIILMMMAAFLGLLVTLGFVEIRRALDDDQALVVSELTLTGHALRAPLAEMLAVEGETRARELLARADTEIANSEIVWVAASALESTLAARHLPSTLQAALARGQDVSTRDGGRLYVFVPVPATKGAIEVSQSLAREQTLLTEIVTSHLIVTVLLVVVALLVSTIAGVRIIGTPMRLLTEHARKIGAGELGHQLSIDTSDEVGELAEEMNRMGARLLEARSLLTTETEGKLKALDQLRHADRLSTVGSLASGMAHELGTPLGIIGGRAKMIWSGGASTADSTRYAQIISAQVERMTKIMRGLLDFARQTPARKVRTDLRVPARNAVELLEPLATKHGIELTFAEAPEGAGTAGTEAFAAVDVLQVEQTIANLVVNAVHATEEGGGAVLVDVRSVHAKAPAAEVARDYVCVSVRDHGKGISPEELPRVFDPFFSTKPVGEGTGLGLAITYGIVQEHGGFVEVTSAIGEGSCFFLYFPS
jgi:signal transduction histidine kinase